jgi:uncharacterized protein (DUF4213/DUF364 family)
LEIQKRLVDFLEPHAGGFDVADVRMGLGYTAVLLDSGTAGVAWTPDSRAACCTHFPAAGTLIGRPGGEVLNMLAERNSALSRALGLATANALLASLPHPPFSQEEVISSLSITPQDRVAMVGYFGPIVTQLENSRCHLDIIELNPHKGNTLTPEQGKVALGECSVAIITATSLINGTCDDLLASLGKPRAAVLLGPSTPFCPPAFSGTGITHLAGATVEDADKVLQVVSQGGGTMRMKPYVSFGYARV